MIGAGEVQRTARELGGQSLALERRWHFGVLQHDAIRESAISNKRAKPIHSGLEAVGLFIVGDNYLVQVQLHTHLASGGFLASRQDPPEGKILSAIRQRLGARGVRRLVVEEAGQLCMRSEERRVGKGGKTWEVVEEGKKKR